MLSKKKELNLHEKVVIIISLVKANCAMLQDVEIAMNELNIKGPRQPHLCFCLHERVWLLYFIGNMSK